MANILFICGKARKRSPTAADVASRLFVAETDFAGLSHDADERLTSEHLKWADTIAVMEKRQLSRLKRQYGALVSGKRLVCLDIADQYEYMQPELVELLTRKLPRMLTKATLR